MTCSGSSAGRRSTGTSTPIRRPGMSCASFHSAIARCSAAMSASRVCAAGTGREGDEVKAVARRGRRARRRRGAGAATARRAPARSPCGPGARRREPVGGVGWTGRSAHARKSQRRLPALVVRVGAREAPSTCAAPNPSDRRVVEVEHEHVAGGVMGEADVKRRHDGERDAAAVQPPAREVERVVVVAVDDREARLARPADARDGVERAPHPRVVERSRDPDVELHAPGRRRRVEQADGRGRAADVVGDPLAIELAPMVALPAAHEREQVARHAEQVVRDGARQRVARRPLGVHRQRRRLVDVRPDAVVVDRDVQAVGRHVLAQRDLAGVVDAPGAAVAMEVPVGVEMREQRCGVGDRRRAERAPRRRRARCARACPAAWRRRRRAPGEDRPLGYPVGASAAAPGNASPSPAAGGTKYTPAA